MKKKKKIITILTALLLAWTCFAFGAAAEENANTLTESLTDGESNENSTDPEAPSTTPAVNDTKTENAGKESSTDPEAPSTTPAVSDTSVERAEEKSPESEFNNIFEDVYTLALDNADKIFAALAFMGSLIIGFGYKKGLLPLLSGGIGKLTSTVDRIKEDQGQSALETEKKMESMREAIHFINEDSDAINSKLDGINARLEGYDSAIKQYSGMKLLLASQIDMLYSIFMSSALPEYQKEEIGRRINEMKKELEIYEKEAE